MTLIHAVIKKLIKRYNYDTPQTSNLHTISLGSSKIINRWTLHYSHGSLLRYHSAHWLFWANSLACAKSRIDAVSTSQINLLRISSKLSDSLYRLSRKFSFGHSDTQTCVVGQPFRGTVRSTHFVRSRNTRYGLFSTELSTPHLRFNESVGRINRSGSPFLYAYAAITAHDAIKATNSSRQKMSVQDLFLHGPLKCGSNLHGSPVEVIDKHKNTLGNNQSKLTDQILFKLLVIFDSHQHSALLWHIQRPDFYLFPSALHDHHLHLWACRQSNSSSPF